MLIGTLTSIGLWAWVKIDPSALRYVALSPDAKDMAENMYRALWSVMRRGGRRVCRQPVWQGAPGGGAEWTGLWRHQAARGRAGAVLQERVVLDGARDHRSWPSTSTSGKEAAHAFVQEFQSGSSSECCSPSTAR